MKKKEIKPDNQPIHFHPKPRDTSHTLTFDLNRTGHGIGIQHIADILENQDICKIPGMPGFIGGSVHFRGKTGSILDLSNAPEPDLATGNNCLILLTVGDSMFGLIVDQIRGVAPSASALLGMEL